MFLELGLPYIMRFINDLRAGKTTIKEKIEEVSGSGNTEAPARTQEEMEVRFMDKVERELGLPDYNLFSTCCHLALIPYQIMFLPCHLRHTSLLSLSIESPSFSLASSEFYRLRLSDSPLFDRPALFRDFVDLSRLRRDGHPVRIRDYLEYSLAACARLCVDQQLRRTEK